MRKIGIALPISGLSREEVERRRQVVLALLPGDVEVELLASRAGPAFLDAQHHFSEAVDAAVALFSTIDPREFAVVVSAGALDPGLARARESCSVPVIGPGEASMYLGWVIGRRLSIVTVDRHAVVATNEFLDQVTLKPPIASIRSMETPVRRIVDDLHYGRTRLVEECASAVRDDGARALYLGSMTLGTLGVTDELQRTLGVPVIDPIRVGVGAAVQCVFAMADSA